jgi:2-amino-4-hydroxy-6-hydroxymethyldihydropteridine diphosphokinase
VLSIGSNLGDRLAHLRSVRAALGPSVVAVSRVYEAAPWGEVDQDDFLNAVIIADDHRGPRDWLDFAHACERAASRVRDRRWGPRTLDVDLVDIDGLTSDEPDLTLPHPRAAQRAFVLVPWLDADPHARLDGRPVSALLAELDHAERDGVHPREELAL